MAFTMRKILTITIIIIAALIFVTARAGASSAILPAATYTTDMHSAPPASLPSTHLVTAAPGDLIASKNLLPTPQLLGDLVAIAWDDLDIPGDQTLLSTIFDLPSQDNSWIQFIVSKGYSSDVTSGNVNQPSIGTQLASEPIIECDRCHAKRYEQAHLLIRGDE